MHVLQLLPSLTVGGVERGVLDLAKGLIARGNRVSVVSSGGPLVKPITELGAMHYQLPVHNKSPLTMLLCIPAVTQIIHTTGVDLVHARSRIPAWIGIAASRISQRPFVTTAHGFYRPHIISRVMVRGRLVIAPSAALAAYLTENFRLPKERIRIVPRGVDLDTFRLKPPTRRDGPWRIGLFSRLSAIKGHEVALRACAQLIQRGIPVTLCIAGDPPESPTRRALELLAEELNLQKSIEWLGIRHDMHQLLESVECVVVPSTYPESFGRVVIEAQAIGRPVVASRVGALSDLIDDGKSGILVPPGDPKALADALARMRYDEALRTRCIDAGRVRVECDWALDRMVDRTIEVYDECLTKKRILIWKLSALGDVILVTPSLRAIRRQFPHSHITLAVGRAAYEVIARCPYVNDILIYDPRGKDRGLHRFFAFIHRLKQDQYDLSIDLQNSRRSHILAFLAGIPVRVGYRRKCGWLLSRAVRLPRVVLTPIAHQQYLLRHVGVSPGDPALELWPSPLDEEQAARILSQASGKAGRSIVGMHPGGSVRWKTKRWDVQRWASLIDALAKQNVSVVVTGGSNERALGEAITRLTRSNPLIAIGETRLLELACLIKRCDVFVTHDTAPLHLAAAVGTPILALFGPTDPPRHLPPNFTGQVINKAVFCSPCYSTYCRTVTHACMKRIEVDEVLSGVLGLLADAELAQEGVGT